MIRNLFNLKGINIVLSSFLIIGIVFTSNAQDITEKLDSYASKFSPERAYLHYDKSSYTAGESIWFKAYVLNELVAANDSKNFYVDWIDDKGRLLQHTIAPLVTGLTNGQFDIPADYKGRYITVKAYTSWMLNFDSVFLYHHTINVLNKDSIGSTQKITIKPVLEFFPEGGDAIAGFDNKVAFKANDQWGRPIKIKGIITNADGRIVDSLRVIHDGMGFIVLKPTPNIKYIAKWKDEQNQEHVTNLPEIKSSGAIIQVTVSQGHRDFSVNLTDDLKNKLDSVYIIGTMFNHPVFKIGKPSIAEIKGIVPIENLPYGVLTITVLDKQSNPIAERITYVDNNALYTFNPEMEMQRWGLSYRARDEIKIKVPENVASSLSISVSDLNIDADSSQNIFSTLMLTSELKGRVYNPAYYFRNPSIKKQEELDLVMLTNGWRRINWQAVAYNQLPKILYPKDTAYLTLSGNVQGFMPGSIGSGSVLMMIMKQKDAENKILLAPIESNGTFDLTSEVVFDTAQIYYQFQDKNLKGSSVQFMPNRLRIPPIGKGYSNLLWPDTTGAGRHLMLGKELNDILQKSKFQELETVTVKAKAKSTIEQMDERYASGLFSGGDAVQFDVANDPFGKVGDIFSYLQGKVAGLQISGQGSGSSLTWRGGAPQLYIDEMPSDVSMVSNINLNDVAYIKAFRPPFMGGFNGSNGAIAIYTRKGSDAKQDNNGGLQSGKVEGYTKIREFYSPKYLTGDAPPEGDRDIRTTIYWNPNVVIDPATKEAVISFYNNDVTDAFRVVIEGMTSDGKLAHIEQVVE